MNEALLFPLFASAEVVSAELRARLTPGSLFCCSEHDICPGEPRLDIGDRDRLETIRKSPPTTVVVFRAAPLADWLLQLLSFTVPRKLLVSWGRGLPPGWRSVFDLHLKRLLEGLANDKEFWDQSGINARRDVLETELKNIRGRVDFCRVARGLLFLAKTQAEEPTSVGCRVVHVAGDKGVQCLLFDPDVGAA